MGNIVISSNNWLGDAVMSMPALQEYHLAHPDDNITMLAKPAVAQLWRMHPAVSDVIVLDAGSSGSLKAASLIKQGRFDCAYIFPNSMRSALVPYLGSVPVRIGCRGHQRAMLLTHVINTSVPGWPRHQSWEYVRIMKLPLSAGSGLPAPRIGVTSRQLAVGSELTGYKTGSATPLVAIMPGAARGPSKCWPAEHYATAGRMLRDNAAARVVVLGSDDDRNACDTVSSLIGEGVVNLCGRTSLEQLAGVLALCHVAISNDSGGMHMAAAVGCRVVAVFGLTDPEKTGPLGDGHRVITLPGAVGKRDISRNSKDAQECLHSIPPDDVVHAAELILSEQ